jgi:hypothetical protein
VAPQITQRGRQWQLARDVLLFVVGIAGITWETLHGPVDQSLLLIFAAMLGLPVVLHKDGK